MSIKNRFRTFLVVSICLLATTSVAHAQYSGGSGEPNDPYQIATATDLIALGETPDDYDKHFIMTADIDLDPNLPGRKVFDKAVIAPYRVSPFEGVFDGNDHQILNMTIWGVIHIGLFGSVGTDGEVLNLGLEGATVAGAAGWAPVGVAVSHFTEGSDYVGGLVGLNDGHVSGCYCTGVVTGETSVGALAGRSNGSVADCYSAASVGGNTYIGGLVGYNGGGITGSYSTGEVDGGQRVGGLVGYNGGGITGSYSTGEVDGGQDVGGLVGSNGGGITGSYSTGEVDGGEQHVGGLVGRNSGAITTSYSTGAATGDAYIGGLVGSGSKGVLDCVWDMETSGIIISDGGVGLTTAEMMDPHMLGLNGLANDPNWILDAGHDYPRLAWEGTAGQIIPEPIIDWLDGSGTEEEPYHIDTADQLILLSRASALWDKNFILGVDIDLDPNLQGRRVFSQAVIRVFSGVFDGNDHTISRLTVTGGDYLGLFGHLRSGGRILNLGLEVVDVNGSSYVGGVVGWNEGSITSSYTTGTITGDSHVGGIGGSNSGDITMSYNTSTTSGGRDIGGLVGTNGGNVSGCRNAGEVTGEHGVGGLVGTNFIRIGTTFYLPGRIYNSYSMGMVTGDYDVGGLVGYGAWASVTSSFWDTDTSQLSSSDGGTGLTTQELQTASTFLEAGWDFVGESENGPNDVWKIVEGQTYPLLSWQKYGGGTGEPNDPYLIYTAEHLNALGAEPNDHDKHFKLMADVDLSGYEYDRAVIAPTISDANDWKHWRQSPRFSGSFDGNSRIISHLTISGDSYLGLFGMLGIGAEICDVSLEAVDVNGIGHSIGGLAGISIADITSSYSNGVVQGDSNVGGLVGTHYGIITYCYSTGIVVGNEDVGGLVGANSSYINFCADIANSFSSSEVEGKECVGGLVGTNGGVFHDMSITTSFSTGGVVGSKYVGGLAGDNSAFIANCYSNSAVTGDEWVGGLVGNNSDEYFGGIGRSYSTGTVAGDVSVGGLVGYKSDGRVTRCRWDIETSGQTFSDGGIGKTTAEMQTATTFLDAGWDFIDETDNGSDNIWWIDEGQDYPRLWWELVEEDVVETIENLP